MKSNRENTIHTHWKGAAEIILTSCSSYYDKAGMLKAMDAEEKLQLETIVKNMAAKSLRCIAFAYKEMGEESGQVLDPNLEENGLTLLGLVGMKDPCRPGARTSVESCRAAGVNVKMITGDNVNTARAIAIECGILNPDGDLDNEAVLEGVQFRNYSPEERMDKMRKIRVMARSSPSDRLLMVQCLKQNGHAVAVLTGDDAPALKEADIGLSMGVQGTEVAKQSSDVVILDDDFTSVVAVLKWGRCMYTNIQKFIQFQLTMFVVVVLVINYAAAVFFGKAPLTPVQLLWVDLITTTLGAIALATEKPTNDLMEKAPVGRSEPLITRIMWRNLTAQALYQITILLVLQFKGRSIFGVDEKVNSILIFNTFSLCQVFNEFNARKLEKKNIFTGLIENKMFLRIIGITILVQLIMVERLEWRQWGACIGLAALSCPIGWLVKCIPVSRKL